MFEVLKYLVDMVGKIFDKIDIAAYITNKKKRELGTALFLTLNALQEMIAQGEELVRVLNRIINAKASGDQRELILVDLCGENTLLDLLVFQSITIARFRQSLNSLKNEFAAICPNEFRHISGMTSSKQNVIDYIIGCLRRGQLVVGTPKEGDFELDQHDCMFGVTKSLGSQPVIPFCEDEAFMACESILKVSRPDKQLEQMKVVAGKIRNALIERFSLEDVLLEIADRRLVAKPVISL